MGRIPHRESIAKAGGIRRSGRAFVIQIVEYNHSTAGSPVLRVGEVGSIEQIENLQPKLQTVLLTQLKTPCRADIQGGEAGANKGIAAQRTQMSFVLQCKGREIKVAVRSAQHRIVIGPRHQVGPVAFADAVVGDVKRHVDCKRIAA